MADGSVNFDTSIDTKKITSQLKTLKNNIGSGLKTAAKVGAAGLSVLTASIGAVSAAAIKMATTTDEIDKMSQKIGISRKAYQEWNFVLSQNGTDISNLQTGMKTLSAAADDVATGGETYTEQFKKLGVSVKDTNGNLKDQETLFGEVFTALSEVEDTTTRTAIASDLLGKSATELAPALNAGTEAIEAQKTQAHELGLVLSDETIDAGVRLTDVMDQMKRAGTALFTEGLAPLMEPISDLLEAFVGLTSGVKGSSEAFSDAMGNLINSAMEIITTALPDIIKIGVNIVASLVSGLIKAVPDLIAGVGYLLGYIIGTIENNRPEILKQGKNLLSALWGGMKNIFPAMKEWFGNIFTTMKTAIIDFWNTGEDWQVALVAGLAVITAGFAAYKVVILATQGAQVLLNAAVAIQNALMDANPIGLIIVAVAALAAGIVLLVKNWDKVTETVKSFFKTVTDVASGIFDSAVDIGKNLIEGLIKGILNIKNKVVDTVKGVGTSILDGLKGVLGIHSPSKEMKTIGEYTAEGFRQGIEDAKAGVVATAEDLGESTKEAVAMGVGGLADETKAEMDATAEATSSGLTTLGGLWAKYFVDAEGNATEWSATMTGIMDTVKGAVGDAFTTMGESVVEGGGSWGDYAKIALSALADVLSAIGKMLLAKAVENFFNFPAAAAFGAGAAAAFIASGVFSAKANSYAVGGVINGDQMAQVHDQELIVPAGIMADAKKTGIQIAPIGASSGGFSSLQTTDIIQIDGKTIAKASFNHTDNLARMTR